MYVHLRGMRMRVRRYYDMCRTLLAARSADPADGTDYSEHPLAKFRFDSKHERERKGEEPRPEEDTSTNPLFKPIPAPSRLESLLIANQMQAYCQQINQFTGQSFAKLFLMQSVNAGGE